MSNPLFWENATIPWITSKDMKTKYLADSVLKISLLAQEGMTTYPKGTLLLVVRSGILKRMLPICILTMDSTINQDIKAFSLIDLSMSSYIFYMLKGMEKYILENYTKQVTTVDSLRFSEFITEMPIPIPPLAEQKRIVAKLDELMTLCDELESEEEKLDALESHFIEYLPKAILQSAAHGKLVPHNPYDEPASELLKRIQQEKNRLVKEGKIKKEKPLPPITENEIPYELPNGWVLCRLSDLASLKIGKTPTRTEEYGVNGKYPWVSIADMETGQHISKTKEYVSSQAYNSIFKQELVPSGSLLFSFKLSIGKVSILDVDAFTNEAICAITPYKYDYISTYLFKVLPALNLLAEANDAIKGKTLNKKSLFKIIVPLPPLAEQQRIVTKIDKLMALCNELKVAYTMPIKLNKNENIVPFSAIKSKEETLLAARGNVKQLSSEAMQAIEDLFAEDEE